MADEEKYIDTPVFKNNDPETIKVRVHISDVREEPRTIKVEVEEIEEPEPIRIMRKVR